MIKRIFPFLSWVKARKIDLLAFESVSWIRSMLRLTQHATFYECQLIFFTNPFGWWVSTQEYLSLIQRNENFCCSCSCLHLPMSLMKTVVLRFVKRISNFLVKEMTFIFFRFGETYTQIMKKLTLLCQCLERSSKIKMKFLNFTRTMPTKLIFLSEKGI